jgi:hypothetical protein
MFTVQLVYDRIVLASSAVPAKKHLACQQLRRLNCLRKLGESEGESSDRCRLPLKLMDPRVLAIPVCLKQYLFSKVWRRGSGKSESDKNDVHKDEVCDQHCQKTQVR